MALRTENENLRLSAAANALSQIQTQSQEDQSINNLQTSAHPQPAYCSPPNSAGIHLSPTATLPDHDVIMQDPFDLAATVIADLLTSEERSHLRPETDRPNQNGRCTSLGPFARFVQIIEIYSQINVLNRSHRRREAEVNGPELERIDGLIETYLQTFPSGWQSQSDSGGEHLLTGYHDLIGPLVMANAGPPFHPACIGCQESILLTPFPVNEVLVSCFTIRS